MDSIQAITFDAGGTLLEPWPSVGHVYAQVARDHGAGDLDPESITRSFVAAWNVRGRFDYTKPAWARLVVQTLENLTPAATDPALFEALWTRFIEPAAWRVFDVVLPSLETLRRGGWRLAVLSNWDERLRPLLEATELDLHFELILPSIDGPAPKPDRRLFALAAERLHLEPKSILHVGDSEAEDFLAAREAGFQALHLVRRRPAAHPDQIHSLSEIAGRLPKR